MTDLRAAVLQRGLVGCGVLGSMNGVRVRRGGRDGWLVGAAFLCSMFGAGARAGDVPTFSETTINPSGTSIKQAYGGDVDNDGFDDLILVMGNTPTKLTILRGNPANPGTFLSPWEVENGTQVGAVLVTDVNRDGLKDTIVASAGLSVYLGNAPGSPNPLQPVILNPGLGGVRLQLARANNDEWPDLTSGGALLANMGATQPGHFTSVATWPLAGVGWGDFDGDGWTDVVSLVDNTIGSCFTWDILIWHNDQHNSFQSVETHRRNYYCENNILSMTSADFNGDGRDDLTFASRGNADSMYVMLARPAPADGNLFPPQSIGGLPFTFAPVVADFNLDGFPDIFTSGQVPKVGATPIGTCLRLFLGSPPPLAGVAFQQMPVGQRLVPTNLLTTGDWNGDGKPDIAACNSSDATRSLTIFWNTTPEMPASCPADLNSDTMVDDADFVIFLEAYNELLCE